MTILHHIDNEVPGFGEWTDVVQGNSTIIQSEAATFPERGSVGLRLTTDGDIAYTRKNTGHTIPPDGDLYLGFWKHVQQRGGSGSISPASVETAADLLTYYDLYSDGSSKFYGRKDDSGDVYVDSGSIQATPKTGRWYYVVVRIHRAATNTSSDGSYTFWGDGAQISHLAGVDNYDRCDGTISVRIGASVHYSAGFTIDYDEIKIATSYPEPFVPTPTNEYPCPVRTVVLYRKGSDDSCVFADYCVEKLTIPRANLIPLTNAVGDESLADDTAYNTQIKAPIDDYFALNPTVAANCMCFLLGYGVPGYSTHNSKKHSVASWLMAYGGSTTSPQTNPLYGPETGSPIGRISVSNMRTAGVYLATRIDSDTLANAKAILDASVTVSALSVLESNDKLYSNDSDYKASLPCQHLRILTSGLGQFANDAFVWGDTATPSFGTGGSRVAFVDTSTDAADSLRAGSAACYSALCNDYAGALGSSDTADTFDAESFFEMLRVGGTFAEACAVAIASLRYTACPAGSPLMTISFCKSGFNIYHATGGPEDMNWTEPVAYARPDPQSKQIPLSLAPGQKHVLGARAVSEGGIEEQNTHVIAYAEADSNGDLLPVPLGRPSQTTVKVLPDGSVVVGFSYDKPLGFAAPAEFQVFTDNGTGELNLQTPACTVPFSRPDQTDFEVVVSVSTFPARFAVRARKGEQNGPLGQMISVHTPSPSVPQLL